MKLSLKSNIESSSPYERGLLHSEGCFLLYSIVARNTHPMKKKKKLKNFSKSYASMVAHTNATIEWSGSWKTIGRPQNRSKRNFIG